MPAATSKTKGLAAKLAEVMGLMQAIPKEGFNKAQHYAFVRETDVAERVSALLAERSIFISQSVVEVTGPHELYRTSSGGMMWLTTVMMEFVFTDGETGEQMGPVRFPGHGADTGDKGIYKAMTGAEKYFLMKTFLVSTGDDPEADEKVDKAAAASSASTGPRVTRSAQPGVGRGGKSDMATEAQVNEIARLTVAAGLDAKGLIPVIQQTLGVAPPEGAKPRDWLGALEAKQAASIISALSKLAESVEEVKPDEEGEQETIDIV